MVSVWGNLDLEARSKLAEVLLEEEDKALSSTCRN